ncbi:MAG: hypothetical protein IJ137_12270 [Eubacterium sp.]|nr:hypothetical protein [Eubacterium sp.]
MAKSKKMTPAQFRKKISALSKEELQSLLSDIYKQCPDAADILNILLGDNEYEKVLLAVPDTDAASSIRPVNEIKITANETVPEEDSDTFYRLWFPLLDYVNKKKKITEDQNKSTRKDMNMMDIQRIIDALWEDTALIDEYVKAQKSSLSDIEASLILSWKNHVTGRFLLERHLKKGSILISMDDSKVYQVKGLKSQWEELFPSYELPLLLDLTLLPYHNVLIYDGLVRPLNVMLGSGFRKEAKEIYMTAKRRGQIITSL